jgi:hypothetical protein
VGRLAAALAVVVVLSGCASRPHEFAGMTREQARRDSIAVSRTMPNLAALRGSYSTTLSTHPLTTLRDRNGAGGDAWLTVFDLTYGQGEDADQACVWAWRDRGDPHFEDAPSVSWGHSPALLHDRCAQIVRDRGIASPDQVMGDDEPSPTIARPQPMTPFGPLVPETYVVDVLPSDTFFLVGPSVAIPAGLPKGTCGFAGIVENGTQTKAVPFARVAVVPSTPSSGVSDGGAWAWPHGAITTTADHWGAFVFANLPSSPSGYDISIRALGYAPAHIVHEPCFNDFAAGDWTVGAVPSFDDATPYRLLQG